jgi:putative two-component system response regulator
VFAVADAIDALTVKRPYRQAFSFERALEEIIKASGSVYDPAVLQAALKSADVLKEYVGKVVIDGMALGMEESGTNL